jgi:hypothetical protein
MHVDGHTMGNLLFDRVKARRGHEASCPYNLKTL